jgi:hypothetical protein
MEQSEGEGNEVGSVEFCVTKAQDGTLTFHVERDGQAEQSMPAPDIGQALKMVLDAYRQEDGGAEAGGYNSVTEPPPPMMGKRPRIGARA